MHVVRDRAPRPDGLPVTLSARITQELDTARLRLSADVAEACKQLHEQSADTVLSLLEQPVREFARRVQASSAPVERMVVLLKECLTESALSRLEHDWYGPAWEQILDWALDSFYAAAA
jgi:hypothetical protein